MTYLMEMFWSFLTDIFAHTAIGDYSVKKWHKDYLKRHQSKGEIK